MSRQTSMGYTTGMLIWISVAWPISPSGIFWPSFSRDDAFLMFTRSGFFPPQGTSMDTGSRPLRQSGYDYGNGKVFPFRRHGGRVYTPSLLFSRDPFLGHIQHHLAFSLRGGGFSWFMTRSCVWDGFIRLSRLGRDTMNVLMSPVLSRLVLFGMCICVVTGCGRHAAREP